MIERRKTPRMAADYEVFVNSGGRTAVARSRDVSERGLGCWLGDELRSGQAVQITLMLPEATLTIVLQGIVKYCVKQTNGSVHPYKAGIEFTQEQGEQLSFLLKNDGITRSVSHSLSIDASVDECYRAIGDFDKYTEWTKILSKAETLDRHPDGRARRVEFHLTLYIRKVSYTLDYTYDDANYCLSFASVGGDIKSATGRYFFKSLGPHTTSATYEATVSIDFPLPERVVSYFSKIAMRKSMKDFKSFVESRNKR